MKAKNQQVTPHTLKRVKELVFFLADRTVYTRLDIMAEKLSCSCRQIRRYLSILKENFGIQFIQKPQGFKLADDRKAVLNNLDAIVVDFTVFHNSVFSQAMLNQG